ncbi:plant-specific domain TIGR01615 family protein [Senna tora]|uniref:Plant-specific domain TIGR01615 family protein n=1 Tax=Senna tora TaxID=362788 RepID=A0A834THP3_9FABA|nr:plant-specific domain TIGR01615 family protein [Senna tora]
MDCRVVAAANLWVTVGGGGVGQIGGGFSHESEHDLALMVSDFLENGSSGAESWCSSDSDSVVSDFAHLAEKIQICKLSVVQYEIDLLSLVHSLILSMNESNIRSTNSRPCYASCIRFYLVKLLRLSGYDAGVCASKWQASGKVPGGDNEYIDVVNDNSGTSERLIIDIDFRSHFEIARAVDSYDRILNSLPVVFVGSFARLKQYLGIMVEAARYSLKQNSMPLPPWRSLAYLQAKWQSPYQRYTHLEGNNINNSFIHKHRANCLELLLLYYKCLPITMFATRLLIIIIMFDADF